MVLRIGASEISISPPNGRSSSKIRKIAPETESAQRNRVAMTVAQECVIGTAESQAREQLLAPAIAGKGAGLAHQRKNDVMIIDARIPPAAQPRQ